MFVILYWNDLMIECILYIIKHYAAKLYLSDYMQGSIDQGLLYWEYEQYATEGNKS